MKLEDDKISMEKEFSELDIFVTNFTSLLDKTNIRYVIVSGYVAILMGRSRGTEDIDIIIEKVSGGKLDEFLNELLGKEYWCINFERENIKEVLEDGIAPRFAEKDEIIPNFEVKYPQDQIDRKALNNRIKVEIDSKNLFISPIELQIAYKLYLGTEMDFEDALHLYALFNENLNFDKLEKWVEKLEVKDGYNELREA